jgi:hypothetical protein
MGHDLITTNEAVLFLFYWLWDESGHGWFATERAAWLVQSGTGYELQLWPYSAKERQASWPDYKNIPVGTIAQVHTHPSGTDPRPSTRNPGANDRLAAIKINENDRKLPIYTVSNSAIWKITPPPELALVQVGFAGWWKPVADELDALKRQQKMERRLERLEAKIRRRVLNTR